jgi:hypothetical protein
MVKRVSSKNRRKGHVRPGNVKRRQKREEKTIAETREILGGAKAAPAAAKTESAE